MRYGNKVYPRFTYGRYTYNISVDNTVANFKKPYESTLDENTTKNTPPYE